MAGPSVVLTALYPPPDKRIRPAAPRILAPPLLRKAPTPYGDFVTVLVDRVDQVRLQQWLTAAVAFPTRHTLSSQNVAAAEWLAQEFRSLGYSDVVFHDFTSSGLTRHNVVCTKAGSVDPSKYLIICGHYDSRAANLSDANAIAPGADDNASGSLALLEIARLLADIDMAWSVRFIAFSGEEQGLVGSTAYANFANSSALQIPLLINLDMIGHPENPAMKSIIVERDMGNDVAGNDAQSQAFANTMVQAAVDYTTIGTSLGPIYSSDYMRFEHHGYVCIGAYDGADSAPFYHTSSDTIDKVDVPFWAQVIRMVTGTVMEANGKRAGAALVFDPDPISTSGNVALTTASAGLDGYRRPVSLQNLDAPDAMGKYHLSGTYCQLTDSESPAVVPPAPTDGVFAFKRTDTGFADTMAYHHIDAIRRHVQTLGLAGPAGPAAVQVDAHGSSSHYDPISGAVAYAGGGGTAPAHAEDAGAVLHQYGHAIQNVQNPGFSSTDGVGSGFCDLVPALMHDEKIANPGATRGITSPWVGSGRRYDRAWTFDNVAITGEAARGEIWASALYELYRNLGGASVWPALRSSARDLMLRLHLAANSGVPASGPTAQQMAQQIEAADATLGGWHGLANRVHSKVIYDEFSRRNLTGYPAKAVDVYVDDGRNGGYAWLEYYWETQDIWVRPAAYTAAQLPGASPADHQEPAVGSKAYLYVKVKNRGTSAAGSGSVTVKAFHCIPGMGLTWPSSWTPMDTPSLTVANILPGAANAQIVGPFDWTPMSAGHECVLVVIECAQDQAITQILGASDVVEHSVLVPFDNNVAQRNLAPVGPKGQTMRRFEVRNPFRAPVELRFATEANLPRGWSVRSEPSFDGTMMLTPGEHRMFAVELAPSIDSPMEEFPDQTGQVRITGVASGRPIGGMTFYLAPESAFAPAGTTQLEPCEEDTASRGDLFCVDIHPDECEIDGQMTARLRFRRRNT